MGKFFVNTGHTLYHAGQSVIHAGEEIAEEIVAHLKKDMAHFKAMLEAKVIVEGEKPVLNSATDKGAPSHDLENLRPVNTGAGQAGPTAPPVVDAAAPALPGGQKSQLDNSGKPVTAGLSK